MSSGAAAAELHKHLSCEMMLTNSCNLSCSYCIASDLPGPAMTSEIGDKAVDTFLRLAVGAKALEITFTGGEPLLEFSLLRRMTSRAIRSARREGMDLLLVLKTNGTVISDEVIEFLRNDAFKVVVSIDGAGDQHDLHRRALGGQRTHQAVVRSLDRLLDNEIRCVASCTVHPDSAANVLHSVRYLHGLGLEEIDIGPAYGTVRWTEAAVEAFGQSLMGVADYLREVTSKSGRLEVGPLFHESDHVGGVLADSWGCHAGSTNLAVLPNGQVSGCSALAMLAQRHPELVIGNVSSGLDQGAVDRLLALAQAGPEARRGCQHCPDASNCSGGCLAISYSTSGNALVSPAVYCRTMNAIPVAWQRAWGGTAA